MLRTIARKRWRLGAVATAMFTSLALVLATGGTSYAAVPGEEGGWHENSINHGSQELTSTGYVAEARNHGALMQIWRSNDTQGRMWISLNSGPAQALPGHTLFNPEIVPWGGGQQFMVFHTGDDNQIYQGLLTPEGDGEGNLTFSGWTGTNLYSEYEVSATQLGANSTQLFLVYRSFFTNEVWGNFYNGSAWGVTQDMGGVTFSAPTITYNPLAHRLLVVHTGTDGHVYITSQTLGSDTWEAWFSLGGSVVGPTGMATTSLGTTQLAARDPHGFVYFNEISPGGIATGWTQDVAHWQSEWPIYLSVAVTTIYALLTGLNGNRNYFKQSYFG